MHEDPADARSGGHVDECCDLPLVAVHATGRQKAQDMQCGTIARGRRHRVT